MTNAPTPAGGRQFSGTAVLAVVGIISLIACTLVIVLVRRDVTKAMDERSDETLVFEAVAHTDESVQPVADDEPGWWSCNLIINDETGPKSRAVSFSLWIPSESDPRSAYLRNGIEFIPVDHTWDGVQLEVRFDHFDSRINARLSDTGDLSGEWTMTRRGDDALMQFEATRSAGDSVYQRSIDRLVPSGALTTALVRGSDKEIWQINFAQSGPAKGVFVIGPDETKQEMSESMALRRREVFATIETPTGDYRYLYGSVVQVKGEGLDFWVLDVSTFDGAHAFRVLANTFDANAVSFDGVFYSRNTWEEAFTATRLPPGEDFDLPDPFSQVGLKPGETKLRLPQLDDPKYAGKPVIVKIMGTWCPNCHDAARLLVEYYEQYHDDGLEILALAYEHTDDEARSLRQIERFKQRLGVTWDIIPAGVSDKQKTAATLPALTDIKSYPTTIFLNRDHTVEAIHSGFSGPATGEAYTKTRAEFERLIKKILDSK